MLTENLLIHKQNTWGTSFHWSGDITVSSQEGLQWHCHFCSKDYEVNEIILSNNSRFGYGAYHLPSTLFTKFKLFYTSFVGYSSPHRRPRQCWNPVRLFFSRKWIKKQGMEFCIGCIETFIFTCIWQKVHCCLRAESLSILLANQVGWNNDQELQRAKSTCIPLYPGFDSQTWLLG